MNTMKYVLKNIDIQPKIILGVVGCLAVLCVAFGSYRLFLGEYGKALYLLSTFTLSLAIIAFILTGHPKLARHLFVLLMFVLLIAINLSYGFEQIFWQFPGVVALTFALRGYREVIVIGGAILISNTLVLAQGGISNIVVTYAGSQLSLIILCGVVVELLMSKIIDTENEADTDSLTGLKNRKAFDKYMRLNGSQKGVILLADIDHFKEINDSYGHATGDQALKIIAQKIKFSVRRIDETFRYGGEEFAIILPDTSMLLARVIAERIRMSIASQAITIDDDNVISCTVSIGAAPLRQDGNRSWISECDRYLYEAKNAGRNCVRYSSTDIV